MKILGIETSCDETAASLLKISNNKIWVLSNVISSQVKLHAKYGGVVPSLAAREHIRNLPKVLRLALGKTKIEDVDLIAVTRGPGLVSSLLVGTAFAKTLAWKFNKPLIGVNHLEGHIASNWLSPVGVSYKLQVADYKLFPVLCLIVSGGHTELALMENFGQYKIIGRTLDDAAGEAFDKIARILGLGYPGGPAISVEAKKNYKLPRKASRRGKQTNLPRPMINSKNFNFSFSGLKTAALYLVRDLLKDNKIKKLGQRMRIEIAAEAQQAIVDVLAAKTIGAAEKYQAKTIMLSGGVSANKLLRLELEDVAAKRGIKFFKPEMEYTTDNAAMTALAGYWHNKKLKAGNKSRGWPNVRVDANLELV